HREALRHLAGDWKVHLIDREVLAVRIDREHVGDVAGPGGALHARLEDGDGAGLGGIAGLQLGTLRPVDPGGGIPLLDGPDVWPYVGCPPRALAPRKAIHRCLCMGYHARHWSQRKARGQAERHEEMAQVTPRRQTYGRQQPGRFVGTSGIAPALFRETICTQPLGPWGAMSHSAP